MMAVQRLSFLNIHVHTHTHTHIQRMKRPIIIILFRHSNLEILFSLYKAITKSQKNLAFTCLNIVRQDK